VAFACASYWLCPHLVLAIVYVHRESTWPLHVHLIDFVRILSLLMCTYTGRLRGLCMCIVLTLSASCPCYCVRTQGEYVAIACASYWLCPHLVLANVYVHRETTWPLHVHLIDFVRILSLLMCTYTGRVCGLCMCILLTLSASCPC